jgi:phenylacetic acid degradation operon negative regulatory protein
VIPYGKPVLTASPAETGRPSPWIITLFGMYARLDDNWLPIGPVVSLMADLGVDGTAVRSSISRLKRRGILLGEKRAGVAGYSLAGSTLRLLDEGDVRIFQHERATTADGWVVVVFSVPESDREKRHELRTTLTRLGFGTVTAGVWVAPGHLSGQVREAIDRRGLTAYVDVFASHHLAFGDLTEKVRSWWNLSELAELYHDFRQRYAGLPPAASALEAFRTYVPMLTEWRRLPYRDPGLPLDLLPPGWNGVAAGHLFDTLHQVLRPAADEHAVHTLGSAFLKAGSSAHNSSS